MLKKREKIKVLYLVEDFNIGGLERVVESVFDGLNTEKYEPSLWCIAKGGLLFDKFLKEKKNIKALNLKTYHNPINIIKLVSFIREGKYQIVHTHGYYASTMGRISAFLARTPIVIAHVHTTYGNFKKRHLKIEKILSMITDKIICCSQAAKEFIVSKEKINPGKIIIIYNGIHCEKYEKYQAVLDSKKQNVIKIAIVASLVENKGHKNLLYAFSKIVKKHKNVKLNIIGDGPLKNQLTDQAKKLRINKNTEFLGIVNNVQKILKNCDILVQPSIFREGLGMAIIEGMCLGKPVIASNIGGIPEVVDNGVNGYLIPPGDYESLIAMLEKLIQNRKLRKKMGKKGRKKYEKYFNACEMIKTIEELYNSLLIKKGYILPN